MVKFKSHTIQSELSVLHCTAGDDFSLHAACRMREVVTHNSLHETQTAAFLFSFGGVSNVRFILFQRYELSVLFCL